MARVIIITGSDSNFFDLMLDTLSSIERVRDQINEPFDVGVIDCGLAEEQRAQLSETGVRLEHPVWPDFVPDKFRMPKLAARFARPRLPEMFPGYEIYLWIDADAWVQDGRFFSEYVKKAESGALVIVHEAERAYRPQWLVFKWNLGNLLLSFGVPRGLYLWSRKRINNGVFALRADAPHWRAWEKYYAEAVERSGKFYNQLAMTAAIYLDRLPVRYVTGEFNWITSRGNPAFDVSRHRFCLPYRGYPELSVIHLAGPNKDAEVTLPTTAGGTTQRSFRFRDWTSSTP